MARESRLILLAREIKLKLGQVLLLTRSGMTRVRDQAALGNALPSSIKYDRTLPGGRPALDSPPPTEVLTPVYMYMEVLKVTAMFLVNALVLVLLVLI